jgi:hypothetical protein
MGCHTWFAKKIEVSHADVKANVVATLQKQIDFYQQLISDRSSIDPELLEAYPEWTIEFGQKYLNIVLRQLRLINEDFCQHAMYMRYVHNDDQTYYVRGRGFYVVTKEMPHDIFRIGGYPQDELYSLQETLDFIEAHKQGGQNEYYVYSFCEDWQQRLADFWKQYPEAQIHFG